MQPEVEVENLPGSRIKLRIKVNKEQTSKSYDDALKQVNKSVSLPGFRKGKAPKEVIEQQYKGDVEKEWRRKLLHAAVNEAINGIEQKPLTGQVDKANLQNISLDDGAAIEVEYETKPLSPALDLKGFKLEPVEEKSVNEEDVEKTLRKLRLYHAEWEKVEGRAVEEGDWVSLEITKLEEPESKICEGRRFEVTKEELPEWMFKLVVGAKINEPVEGKSKKDKNPLNLFGDEEGAFKPANYRLTVQEIAKPKLPDFDEETLKKFGVENIEQLRTRVNENLTKEASDTIRAKKREQLEKWLLEKYPLDLPQTLLDHEKSILIENYVLGLFNQGVTNSWIEANAKEIEEKILNYAKLRLSLIYLLRGIAKERDIQISMDELNREMIYEQALRPPQERLTTQKMEERERQTRLYLALLTERTLDTLIEELK